MLGVGLFAAAAANDVATADVRDAEAGSSSSRQMMSMSDVRLT